MFRIDLTFWSSGTGQQAASPAAGQPLTPNVMFTKINKTFLVTAVCFFCFYALYAFVTYDYIEGFSAKHPEMWTVYRISTVSVAIIIAFVLWLTTEKQFHSKSFVAAAVAGGWWLLFSPFWYGPFSGFSFGLPFGAAINYGVVAGLFGALFSSRRLAALIGIVTLIAQIATDIVGYAVIVGYAGFH